MISLTDSAGTLLIIDRGACPERRRRRRRRDEYGKPQSTNAGRFQYTGQKWLGEAGLYDYKARAYLPHLGIFGQTDPIGYAGSPNLYAYVLNDPVNLMDPLGLCPIGTVDTAPPPKLLPPTDPNDPSSGGVIVYAPRCIPLFGVDIGLAFGPGAIGGMPQGPAGPPTQLPPPPCGSPADGPVNFTIDEFTTVPGGGIAVAWGTFRTGSGGRGTFESSGFALGFELGLNQRHGSARDLGTFTGASDSLSGGIFGLSFSISRSQSSGAWYGSIGIGVGKPKIGGSVSTTDTNITSLTCP